jgi:AraC family transcriptional regulator
MGEALPEVWLAAERLGLRPLMPFARYFSFEVPVAEFEPPQIEFEAGVVVDGLTAYGEGRVQPVQLPGGELAVACHVGPYELLSQTYEAMQRWIAEQGRTASGPMWEVYLDDPDTTPMDQLRTEVVIPLA